MGCKLCKKLTQTTQTENSFCPNEKEIKFLDYKSTYNDLLDVVDRRYNFFTYISLIEYMNLLESFSIETSTSPFEGKMRNDFSSKDQFLTQTLNVDEFHSFIENKLLKISSLTDTIEKNTEQISIFKDAFLEIFNSLLLKLKQNYTDKEFDSISKRDLITIGLLFCDSNNIDKIKVFFDIFKNEEGKFVPTPELDEFLLCSFLISSYCMISARKKVTNENLQIPALEKEDLLKMVKVSELKDSQNLLKIFNENFFKSNNNYNWEEFKNLFSNKNTGFGWIFSSNGIRQKLEENNV